MIGQHDMPGTRTHRVLGFGADPAQRRVQRPFARLEGTVDLDQRRVELLGQLVILRVADKRAFQHDDLGLAAVLVQHVLQVAEPRLQAHHPVFPQRVDRRVGHLGKVLAEEMAQRPVLFRQHRAGRVVTHAGQRLLAVLGHRRQQLLQFLNGITRRDLALAQFLASKQRPLGHAAQRHVGIVDLADPFAKGLRRGQLILDLGVVVQLAVLHIDGQQLARAQRALFLIVIYLPF